MEFYKATVKIHTYFLISILFLAFQGCKSAQSAYEEGDYYTAVTMAVEKLRKNPDHMNSQEILHKAYPLAVSHFKEKAKNYENTPSRFKYGKVLSCYGSLNNLYQDIKTCPGAMKVIHKPQSFYKEANKYRELAAEERYLAADQSMAKGTREDAKEAYFLYKDAMKFIVDYKDAQSKSFEAKEAATLNVLFAQGFDRGVDYNMRGDLREFQNSLKNYLINYRKNEFVRFCAAVSDCPDNLHQKTTFTVKRIDFGILQSKQSTEEVESDSVVVGQYTDSDGIKRDVYGVVKAKVTTFYRSLNSDAQVKYEVMNLMTSQRERSKEFSSSHRWEYRWASYQGDERALTSEHKRLLKNGPPTTRRPNDSYFIEKLFDNLASQVRNDLDRYYKQF